VDVRRIRVRRRLAAPVDAVWSALADIPSHVTWMADAEAITFTSRRREGVGTTFDCATKVGPLRLNDKMEVTEWSPRRAMTVRHVGLVTGEGRFTLHRRGRRRTELVWEEALSFPWWIPSWPAAVVLAMIWRGNLRRLERSLPTGLHGADVVVGRLLRRRRHARR
jgi:carbon monoxide dehydrogenase subunit G